MARDCINSICFSSNFLGHFIAFKVEYQGPKLKNEGDFWRKIVEQKAVRSERKGGGGLEIRGVFRNPSVCLCVCVSLCSIYMDGVSILRNF